MSDADAILAQRPAGPVIPAAELGLWTQATEVLAAARAQAVAAQKQAEDALEAERARGFEAGLRAAASEVAKQFARMAGHRAALEAEINAALPDLLCDVLERLLGESPAPDVLARAIRHAVAQQRWEGRAVLRVAPVDTLVARAAIAGNERATVITVEPDAAVPAGTCQFECAHGSIELGLQAQLRAMRDGLAKGWQDVRSGAPPASLHAAEQAVPRTDADAVADAPGEAAA